MSCTNCNSSTNSIKYSCTKTPTCNRISLELSKLTRVYEWFNGQCELDINGDNTGNILYRSIGEMAKYEQHHLDNYDKANLYLTDSLDKTVISKTKYKKEFDIPDVISPVQLANILDITVEAAKILLDNRFTQNFTACPKIYYNVAITGTAQRNNCPPNYTGSTVTYTIPARAYSSVISQVDAQNLAQVAFNTGLQAYANTTGVCTENTRYGNTAQCTNWTRNNCPFNHTTSPVQVCIAANTFFSYISQIDANNIAIARLDATKQDLANQLGVCTPVTFYNTEQTFTANCTAPATGTNTVIVAANTVTSTVSQADANSKALLNATLAAQAGLVCTEPALPTNLCVTFPTSGGTVTVGAIGVYTLEPLVLINNKPVYRKTVQNELDGGVIENWIMQWQWSDSLNVWQLFRFINGSTTPSPSNALSQTNTADIIGSATGSGNIAIENFTPGVLCYCQATCYTGTLLTDVGNPVSTFTRGFIRDFNYLYKNVETHFSNGNTQPPNPPNGGIHVYRWRKENNNLWRLMNYNVNPRIEVDRKTSGLLLDITMTNNNRNQILNPTQVSVGGSCNGECV